MDKMIEEHGADCFTHGCPVCKKLCCCSEKSMNCTRKVRIPSLLSNVQYHCYKKCLTTKKGIKKAPIHQPEPVQPPPPVVSSLPIQPSVPVPVAAPVSKPVQPPMAQALPPQLPPFKPEFISTPVSSVHSVPTVPAVVSSVPIYKPEEPLQKRPSLTLFPVPSSTFGLASGANSLRQFDSFSGTPLLMPLVSSRFSLSRVNSGEAPFDPYFPPVLSRESLSLSGNMVWDPAMCQLQRAPDSVQVMNNSVYDAQGAVAPMLLPLKQVPSSGVVRRPSLLAQNVRVEMEKKETQAINSEVCFDEDLSNDGTTEGKEAEAPYPAVIVKRDSVRSTGSDGSWVNLEPTKQVSPVASAGNSVHYSVPEASVL